MLPCMRCVLRIETRRCVKIRLQPCHGQALGEAYSAPPSFRIAAFGEGNGEVEWKTARGGKGMEGEGNEGGRENLTGEDGMEFRVSVSGIDTPSDSDGQPPEIATWSPSSEIFISLELQQIALKFPRQISAFSTKI